MPKTKKKATPKFQVGDVVKEKERVSLLVDSPNTRITAKKYGRPRTNGVVKKVFTKKDRSGSAYFFYVIDWKDGRESEHAQMRLTLASDGSSQ